MFTDKDIKQIKNKGIALGQVKGQILRLINGMSYANLIAAADIGNEIDQYDESETKLLIEYYRTKKESQNIIKFVPASGASSRMFKFLFKFLSNYDPLEESVGEYISRTNDTLMEKFVSNLEYFPFYEFVLSKLKTDNPNNDGFSKDAIILDFVKTMLNEEALNYSFLPKGLLPFHKYSNEVITAFQEHLFESTLYAFSKGKANLHFTVSEMHHKYFDAELEKFKVTLEEKTNTKFCISYSYQKEATETLALNLDNTVFRKKDGSILFRPAGHGALLENLNDLDADIVFIKNIDNIVISDMNREVSVYKELLAGVLLKVQEQVFSFLYQIDNKSITEDQLNTMVAFASHKLNLVFDDAFNNLNFDAKIANLKDKFNRPIRVCGMVKNEGEPGGGAFWVKDEKSESVSLQILEFAQIDFNKKSQSDIVKNAKYFNPTDLVCGVKDYKGQKFNLMDFVDPDAAFITMKTVNGVDIKALESPGLWNGSMAYWNSIFVAVPLETFNPVKTVNDLLRPAHQVKCTKEILY